MKNFEKKRVATLYVITLLKSYKVNMFFQVDLEHEREVSIEDGKRLAGSWGCPFFETSAKSKRNVDQLFAEIVRETNHVNLPRKKKNDCCIIL